MTGICSNALAGASSFVNSPSSARTIREAADRLNAGDIILLEIHRPGPNANGQGQFGFIAIEWWPDDYAAIRYATNKNILVVEAAGKRLPKIWMMLFYDQRPANFPASWRNPFNPANPSSLAVVVGAGAPPPGTHGRNWGADRSRLGFSNYGKRVDCQGWGREVDDGRLWGSSRRAAEPLVHGNLQWHLERVPDSRRRARLRPRHPQSAGVTPADTCQSIGLLRSTGSPQQDTPGRPQGLSGSAIGPNLRQNDSCCR